MSHGLPVSVELPHSSPIDAFVSQAFGLSKYREYRSTRYDAAPVISEIQVVLSHHNVLSSTKSASQFFSNPWDVGDAENAVVIEARK